MNNKIVFFQKLGYSFFGSGIAEKKKEWNMGIMIYMKILGKIVTRWFPTAVEWGIHQPLL
jgi:hypothetical protein